MSGKFKQKKKEFHITNSRGEVDFPESRDILTRRGRDMSCEIPDNPNRNSISNGVNQKTATSAAFGESQDNLIDPKLVSETRVSDQKNLSSETEKNIGESRIANSCPYCRSKDFVRRGTRQKKLEKVQLYLCGNCARTFTAQFVKGKHYPMNLIIEGMNYYNLGYGLEETCTILKQKFGAPLSMLPEVPGRSPSSVTPTPAPATLSGWIEEYKDLCRYERLRPYAVKMFSPQNTVEVVTMAHRQLYRFRYHRVKTILMLEEFKNRNLRPLKDYLDNVSSETPHQYFQEGERMSEVRSKFDRADMIVRSKTNYANRLADFVLQAVSDNKRRHEELQRFFIANDSVTVATEVPVYIRKEDIEHMENVLKFKITDDGNIQIKGQNPKSKDRMNVEAQNPNVKSNPNAKIPLPKLLTGHIDIVQIRNGQIHLLDYKPNASKEKPIEQLTWYALAMSRLTGLRLFEFKCGWFDEKDFYEFFPLHVVKKTRYKKNRRVKFKDGTMVEVPKENVMRIV